MELNNPEPMTRYHATENGLVPFTAEEEAEWDAQEALWKAGETDRKARAIRVDRNHRLADCDWTQGKDIPDHISNIWSTYRQSLRDIPQQSGFPWDVQWPEQP